MKIWMRYLLGTAVGIALGTFLPLAGGDTVAVLRELSVLVVRVGRFFLFPMAFFAAIVAMDELVDDRRVARVVAVSLLTLVGVLIVAVVIGVLSIVVLQPARIPPMVQEGRSVAVPDLLQRLTESIPGNVFRLLVWGDDALFGVVFLGLLVGATLRFDREITSPVSLVADSANRILYRLNAFVTAVMGFLLPIPTAMVLMQARRTDDIMLFGQFLLVVVTGALFVGVVVYPLVLFLLDRRNERPLTWLHRMTPAGIAALTTGDLYVSLATFTRVGSQNLGLPRRVGGVVTPIMAVFGRAGTALVSVAAFLLVIRSYTALETGVGDVIQLALAGVMYSFFLGRNPTGAVMVMLSYLAVRYGRGMEESYLILMPVMPLLERVGAWLDMMTVGFVSHVVARKNGYLHRVERTV